MWAIFIMLVLLMGYIEITSTPIGRVLLRKSQGWESYALLAKNGLKRLWRAAKWLLGLMVLLVGVLSILNILFDLNAFSRVREVFIQHSNLSFYIFLSMLFVLAFFFEKRERNLDDDIDKAWSSLQSQDGMLGLILDAAHLRQPLRVTLKSRKVYVGIIQSEQFERPDLDNIAIIPFLSGYRDKDTLSMTLDQNYYSVYQGLGIQVDDDLDYQRLHDYRVVIRLGEVESLSFFDMKYYVDFQKQQQEHVTDN